MSSQNDIPSIGNNGASQGDADYMDELLTLFKSIKQAQQNGSSRLLSKSEKVILTTINNCLTSWYKPWKRTFLSNACEFKTIYNLMEDLIHYEDQITNSESVLSGDRINAIAHAVARLVDLGNAVLSMDLVVRTNDELSSELDPTTVTTVELFLSHVKAHKLREKLVNNYFKKRDSRHTMDDSGALSNTLLKVPSPKLERAHRTSIGSNTSINTIISEGRRTPQPKEREIEVKLQNLDLTVTSSDMNLLEVTHMLAAMRSGAFLGAQSSTTRLSVLPKIINKIKSLLNVPTSAEKLGICFELLGTMLSALEKLPIESRGKEVDQVAKALLQPIVRKVYIDDRDNIVEFQHAHWTTCLLSIVRLMTAAGFSNYLKHFSNSADLSAFLKDYLFIVKRIISSSNSDKNINSPSSAQIDLVDSMTNQQNPPYPDCWIEMTLLASSTFLTSLTYLYQILRQYFSSNLQMWYSFIDSLIHFILQDAIKSERLLLKSRQRMLADNLRQTAAEYVWISWDSLSQDQKQQLMEDLTEPLLKACISLESRQRSILLPIFYAMMRCDFTSQYVTPRGSVCSLTNQQQQYVGGSSRSTRLESYRGGLDMGDSLYHEDDLESLPPLLSSARISISQSANESLPYLSCRDVMNSAEDGTVLTKFTHLVVGKLNTLMIDLNLGDFSFKQELCAALAGELNPKYFNRSSSNCDTAQFKSLARHTANLIAEFMQICLDLREANHLFYNDLKLLCLFKLILFFRDKVDRPELYLSNLFKLCYLHHTAARYMEAGYTLLEHAKQLNWSRKPLELHYTRLVTRFFQISTPLTNQTSLKAFLYTTIVEYFDQGQLWEAAVPLCRELIDLYQYRTYEYQKLAQMLQRLSGYFSNIVKSNGRSFAEYFRVTYYGCGFPEALRNVTMVFRGRPFEKLGDFQNLMLNEYTDARLLPTLAKPDPAILEIPGSKYLQINACSPVVDLKSKLCSPSETPETVSLPEIDESILNYYRYNECDKFTFSRRISGPPKSSGANGANDSDNFANMWRERTTLSTNTLPGMLFFFPVYLLETSTVSPIESAIEDLERTNDRLSCMVNRFRADKRQAEDIRLLGQLLLGIVDAAVNGGITKYEQAFFLDSSSPSPSSPATSSHSHSHSHSHNHNRNHNHNKQSPENNLINHLDGGGGPADDQQLLMLSSSTTQQQQQAAQVDKLKCLIGQQLPLLDEAIRLHRDRVADVMRPQHEHLEASYKKLKHHVMSKYSRHLPADYNRTMRSFRSLTRSPNRSMRLGSATSDSIATARLPSLMLMSQAGTGRLSGKRMSDLGPSLAPRQESADGPVRDTSSNIPYKQLQSERRSLPFLPGVPLKIVKAVASEDESTNQDEDEEEEEDAEVDLNDGGGELVVIPPLPERPEPVARTLLNASNYVELEPNLKPSMLLSPPTKGSEGERAEEEDEEKLVTF